MIYEISLQSAQPPPSHTEMRFRKARSLGAAQGPHGMSLTPVAGGHLQTTTRKGQEVLLRVAGGAVWGRVTQGLGTVRTRQGR